MLNIFLCRSKELNIPEMLTTNIRKLLEELHSVHTCILNIIITEHDFVLNLNHPCSLLSADLGGSDLEFQHLKLIDSMMYTGLGKILLFI